MSHSTFINTSSFFFTYLSNKTDGYLGNHQCTDHYAWYNRFDVVYYLQNHVFSTVTIIGVLYMHVTLLVMQCYFERKYHTTRRKEDRSQFCRLVNFWWLYGKLEKCGKFWNERHHTINDVQTSNAHFHLTLW